ncbi:RHS repeat-associated core domain-containing protein [Haloferula helveola]|uniref:RHS repeat-associated core domain-containing protein n=1 Tax=Haloferula helveola TaxID=490095 RepID=A0ABN6GYH7_9BACT|nr:RHS repeat-associated core domain-containing protein [Haloferula helveola]
MKPHLRALIAATLVSCALGDTSTSPPVLQLASGLPGQQVRLGWASEAGLRYSIERSEVLGAGSDWSVVAIVDSTGASSEWTDPLPTKTRAFYRIVQPQAEVFSIAEPILASTGGALVIRGQCIPNNSFLTLDIDGLGLASAALVANGAGEWIATFPGPYAPGALVLSAEIIDGGGSVLAPVDIGITITETGFASDAPPNTLPPAAPYPMGASIPVPGVGVVIKKHPGNSAARNGVDDDCDGLDDTSLNPLAASIPVPGVGVVVKKGSGGNARRDQDDDGDCILTAPEYSSAVRLRPGQNGMPGEVSLEYDAITLVSPAGPPVSWMMCYRSMAEVSSGHGSGWDFAYNISIDATSNVAPVLRVRDGSGRNDEFRRANDGTYSADGFSRVGEFVGDVFTLTFANGGTWTFHPVDGSTTSGKIETITDPNGNTLTCTYDPSGQIKEVEDGFGRDLGVAWSGNRIISITDHTGRSVSFTYYGALESGGSEGDLKSIGCPTESGLAPLAGDTVFTYSTGTGISRLDHNLLSITDGAGRVLESFTYAATANSRALEFDSVVAHSAHVLPAKTEISHSIVAGRHVVYDNDELGRVTEVHFDRLHRPLVCRSHTGFHPTPGSAVAPSDFPLPGKLRSSDPEFFETTWTYNADSNVSSMIAADGSGMLTTYEQDLNPRCPVIERGNARVQTLVSSLGEKRSITMRHEPGFGTPECARPGNPIGGLLVKGGRNPGSSPSCRPGNPIGGLNIKVGKNPGGNYSGRSSASGTTTRRRVEVLKSNKQGDPNANRYDFGSSGHTTRRRVEVLKSNKQGDPDANRYDFGTATPGHSTRRRVEVLKSNKQGDPDANRYDFGSPSLYAGKKGYDAYQVRADMGPAGAFSEHVDDDCDGSVDDSPIDTFTWTQTSGPYSRLSSLTTSHGQTFTWAYDANGNCIAAQSPVTGGGAIYLHDGLGRLTEITIGNGATGEFHDTLTYGPDGYLQSYTKDSTAGGRNLVTAFEYDALGRCTRIVDPMNDDWLLDWSALDVCTKTQSPPVAGQRIATDFVYDASGRLVRCDIEHRDSTGALDPTNPAYSTFWVYDSRGRLSRIADEDRPTDNTGLLEPDPLTVDSFALTDFTYDDAGQLRRASTPAANRGQATDSAVDLTYDERGLLHHVIAGGSGNPDAVTTEYDYDTLGACVREACLAPDGGETLYGYDGYHRRSSVTDAMGNEAVFSYDEGGRITTSIYGETSDVPGSTNNTLLARTTAEYGNNENWDFGGGTDLRRRFIARGIKAEVRRLVDVSGSRKKDDGSGYRMPTVARPCPRDRPFRCGDGSCRAFFDVYQEDDVIETERFSPGDSPPFDTETLVLDRSPAGLLMNVTLNGDLLDSFTYDSNGALSSISNSARTVDFNRDGREDIVLCTVNNVIKVTLPPPNMALVHTISRNALGRVTAVTDGAGNASTFTYDSLGRVTSETAPGRAPVTFAYDGTDATGDYTVVSACDIDNTGAVRENGRYVLRAGVPLSFTDSNGYSGGFTYDGLDRLTRCDYPDGTYEEFDYDSRGILSSIRHRDGSTTNPLSDPLTHIKRISHTSPPPGVVASGDIFYEYDGLGRLVSASQDSSLVTMTWDSIGNPTSETSNGLTVSRTFNHRGRTGVTYPDSTSVSEARNELGQLTDVGGNLIRYVGTRIYQTEQTNGVITTYSYRGEGDTSPPGDASYGSCVRVTAVHGTTTLADTFIQHSPDQLVTEAHTLFSADVTGPSRTRTYGYDGLGRLTSALTQRRETLGGAVQTESDISYTLDTAGRRLVTTGGRYSGSYTQDSANPPGDHQAGQYTTWPGGNLEWDERGSLTLLGDGPDYIDFDSDNDGRLVALNDPAVGTPIVGYTYDALGRLSTRTEYDNVNGLPPVTTSVVYDGTTAVQELDDPNGTGQLSAALTFVCDDGGFKHCISTRNGTYYYPMNTSSRQTPGYLRGIKINLGLGLTSNTGAVLERYDQDEAGEPLLLDPDGQTKSSGIGPVRWMAPEAMKEKNYSVFIGSGGSYSSQLRADVTVEKFHVRQDFGPVQTRP